MEMIECRCGCGELRPAVDRFGIERRYINGHRNRGVSSASKNAPEDVWRLISRRGPDECWPWIGKWATNRGYGMISVDMKRWTAHRLVYTLVHGPISNETHVCHACDNPPCCNPNHLFPGTVADNMRDKTIKGRNHGTKLKPCEIEEVIIDLTHPVL